MKKKTILLAAISLMGLAYWSCEKEEGDEKQSIQFSGMETINRQDSSITVTGKLKNNTGKTIEKYGFVYDTVESPDFSDSKFELDTNAKAFDISVSLDGLLPGRDYYVKPYVISGNDTVFGTELSFATTFDVYLANFTYSDAFDITSSGFKTSMVFESHGLGDLNTLCTLIYDSTGKYIGGLARDGLSPGFVPSTYTLQVNYSLLEPSTTYQFRVEARNLNHPYVSVFDYYRSPIFSELRTFRTPSED